MGSGGKRNPQRILRLKSCKFLNLSIKKELTNCKFLNLVGSGEWNRTTDLQVMSLISYHCSTPQRLVVVTFLLKKHRLIVCQFFLDFMEKLKFFDL